MFFETAGLILQVNWTAQVSWVDAVSSVSTLAAAIATVVGVILALKQLSSSLAHASEQRDLLIEQQDVSIKQQQNAIVMQLWQNWDNALDIGSTRDDLRRFISWVASETDDPDFCDWMQLFVQGHSFDGTRTRELLSTASPLIRDKFDTDSDGLTIHDITRIRSSLNRFLNMVEQATVAFHYKFGNTVVMEQCMIPTLKKYTIELLPYMNAIRAIEPETWDPIYEVFPHLNTASSLPVENSWSTTSSDLELQSVKAR